jgi:hypothetical protein
MLAGRGQGKGRQQGEGVSIGAAGFEQGTSKDGDSKPYTKSLHSK